MGKAHQFSLSVKEFEFLRQLASRDDSLGRLLSLHADMSHRIGMVRLSCAEVEQLRDYLTTELAETGFDKDYRPNENGEMLERLIDKFYTKKRSQECSTER